MLRFLGRGLRWKSKSIGILNYAVNMRFHSARIPVFPHPLTQYRRNSCIAVAFLADHPPKSSSYTLNSSGQRSFGRALEGFHHVPSLSNQQLGGLSCQKAEFFRHHTFPGSPPSTLPHYTSFYGNSRNTPRKSLVSEKFELATIATLGINSVSVF